MRDYGKLSPFFWTRGSGKRLRGDPEAQVVAAYLSTSPSANMIGIYYVALVTISNDTGVALERVREALGRIERAGYAFYDFDAELVWIPNHARFELGATMTPGDKRRKRLIVELTQVGDHRFADAFARLYGGPYGISLEPPSRPPPPPDPPNPEGASGNKEGASDDLEPIQSGQSQSNPSRERAREEGVVSVNLPFETDAREIWDSRTFTRSPDMPAEECWMNFCGQYTTQDFGSRQALLGRWSKWIGDQCKYAEKDRKREREWQDKRDRRNEPPEPVKETPEQAQRFAKELADRVAARRARERGAA